MIASNYVKLLIRSFSRSLALFSLQDWSFLTFSSFSEAVGQLDDWQELLKKPICLPWERSFLSFQSFSKKISEAFYHLILCDRSLYFSNHCDRSQCKSRLRWHDRSATRSQLRWPPDGCIVLLIFIHILYIVIVLLLLTECIINSGDHQLVAFCDDWILIHLNPFGSIWVNLSLFESIWVNLNPFESIWVHLNPFESIWIHLSPFESIWVNLNAFESIWVNLCQFESIWIHSYLNQFEE